MIRLIPSIGTLPGLGIVRVSGLSMVPALDDGDFVLFRRFSPADHPPPGGVVIVHHPHLGTIIKVLDQEIKSGYFRLRGLSVLSTDSNHMGDVARQNIIGEAVLRIGRHGASGLGVNPLFRLPGPGWPRWSGLRFIGLDVKNDKK